MVDDPSPGAGSDTPGTPRPHADGPPPVPRWVKILGGVLVVLVLVATLAMVLGGGDHGPGRHGAGDVPTPGAAAAPIGG